MQIPKLFTKKKAVIFPPCCLNLYSPKTAIGWCSSSSSWDGPCTETLQFLNAPFWSSSAKWRSGRKNITGERDAQLYIACKYWKQERESKGILLQNLCQILKDLWRGIFLIWKWITNTTAHLKALNTRGIVWFLCRFMSFPLCPLVDPYEKMMGTS